MTMPDTARSLELRSPAWLPHTWLLAVFCGLLAAVLVVVLVLGEIGFGSESLPRPATGESRLERAPSPPLFPPLASFAATLERPVFIATRRLPPERATGASSGSDIVLGRYRLAGVVMADRRRIVRLQPLGGGKTIELSLGSEIDGWRVSAIERDFVELRSGRQSQRIPLIPTGRR